MIAHPKRALRGVIGRQSDDARAGAAPRALARCDVELLGERDERGFHLPARAHADQAAQTVETESLGRQRRQEPRHQLGERGGVATLQVLLMSLVIRAGRDFQHGYDVLPSGAVHARTTGMMDGDVRPRL